MRTLHRILLNMSNGDFFPGDVIASPRKYPVQNGGFKKDHQNLSNDARVIGNDMRKALKDAQEVYGG